MAGVQLNMPVSEDRIDYLRESVVCYAKEMTGPPMVRTKCVTAALTYFLRS